MQINGSLETIKIHTNQGSDRNTKTFHYYLMKKQLKLLHLFFFSIWSLFVYAYFRRVRRASRLLTLDALITCLTSSWRRTGTATQVAKYTTFHTFYAMLHFIHWALYTDYYYRKGESVVLSMGLWEVFVNLCLVYFCPLWHVLCCTQILKFNI